MDNSADDAPRLVAAPRHLRRRMFHEEIPDELLVPGVEPFPSSALHGRGAKRAAAASLDAREVAYRRKRLVALVSVLVVVISVPALVIALLVAG
ncbi:hypothetical protein [Arthrobacter sp. EPSL27]|uniref:hypothetical protein n=1 Tax=Arthrobacter sp. EPSL27 TaxID=1745378 RepID=UPI000749583B|nr:hypothetical protein [Arthrobacter sp. EPSL27]KUM41140.1 hypothetical protein AR539_00390 [Arthrobacter sp. EPSL27]